MLFSLMLIFVIILGLILGLVIFGLSRGTSGLKIMLLGINVTLLGGIIAVDPNYNLVGIEYLIVLSGLVISAIGLLKKD